MSDKRSKLPDELVAGRRKAAVRTALWFGLVAAVIYIGFILTGVIGR